MNNPTTCKLTIRHKDPAMIETLVNAYIGNRLFGEFIWCPSKIESMPSYVRADELSRTKAIRKYGVVSCDEWRVANWGTSSEVGAGNGRRLEVVSANEVYVEFATEGHAPVNVIEHWVDVGCRIDSTIVDDQGTVRYRRYEGGYGRTGSKRID